jgi:hypothetical protein
VDGNLVEREVENACVVDATNSDHGLLIPIPCGTANLPHRVCDMTSSSIGSTSLRLLPL